jgi:hypothetical protein
VNQEAAMFRIASLMVLLFASTMLPGLAFGEPASSGLKRQLTITHATAAIVVPVEWGGIWTVEDSTYDCAGVLQSVETSSDTLCPGEQTIDPNQFPGQFDCTGSADATSLDVTCSGTSELFPDCSSTFTSTLRGTRTGENYFVVSTVQVTYSGTAEGCDLVPGFCMQVNSHATRTGPVPVEYCQTPVRPTTWGSLKLRYR